MSVNTDKSPPSIVSKIEAAEILGVSTRTIEREVTSGRLPKHKIRGCVRFLLQDVLRIAGIESSTPTPS